MPELCRFAGIIIKLLYNDTVQHNKPHVHVFYGEYEASVGVDGELLAGALPVKQLRISTKKKSMPRGTKLFAANLLKKLLRWNKEAVYVYQRWYCLCGGAHEGNTGSFRKAAG